MATVKKGILSPAGEWWDHLRWTKRSFWHRERAAERQDVEERMEDDSITPSSGCVWHDLRLPCRKMELHGRYCRVCNPPDPEQMEAFERVRDEDRDVLRELAKR